MDDDMKRRLIRHLEEAVKRYNGKLLLIASGDTEGFIGSDEVRVLRRTLTDAMADAKECLLRLRGGL